MRNKPGKTPGLFRNIELFRLPRDGHMGDGAPNTVGFVVYSDDPNRDPRTSGRPAAFGIGAEAVDAAV